MKTGKLTAFIFFFAVVICCAAYSFFKPVINWDLIAYTGSVYSLETGDTGIIHTKTYQTIRQSIDSAAFLNLTSSNYYRSEVFGSAESFYQQLQFYKVKPLYILFVYVIYKTGIPLVSSFKAAATLSYFGICITCLIWLMRIYRDSSFGIWLAALISLSPFLLYVSAITTPDMFSAAVVFLSFYFLLQKKNVMVFAVLMVIACLIRQDNFFTLVFTGAAILIYKDDTVKNRKIIIGAAIAAAFILIAAVQLWAGSYGWEVYFQHAFGDKLTRPAEYTQGFSILTYLNGMKTGLSQFRFDSFMTETLILAVTIYMKRGSFKNYKNDFELLALFSIIGAGIFHLLVYPSAEDRFFTAQYMIINIIFLKNIYEKFSYSN